MFDKEAFVAVSKVLVEFKSVTVVPSKKDTDDRLLFVIPKRVHVFI